MLEIKGAQNKYSVFPKRMQPTSAIPRISISVCSMVYSIKKQIMDVTAQARISIGLLIPHHFKFRSVGNNKRFYFEQKFNNNLMYNKFRISPFFRKNRCILQVTLIFEGVILCEKSHRIF